MQGSWGVTLADNRGLCIIEQSCRCSPAAVSSSSSPCLRGRVCFRLDMTSLPCQTLTTPSKALPMAKAASCHASRYEEYDCPPRLPAVRIGAYEWACRAGSYGYDGWLYCRPQLPPPPRLPAHCSPRLPAPAPARRTAPPLIARQV